MIQRLGDSFSRLLMILAPVLVVGACTSAQPDTRVSTATGEKPMLAVSEWEESTRSMADTLMAQAQQLTIEGRTDEAIARADDAICIVLQIPPSYRVHASYIEYLADLIDEADEIEATTLPLDVDLETAEELVILPPLDLFVDETETADDFPRDDGPLPESDYPLVMNPTVEKFLSAMTSDGEYHQRIEVGLSRAGAYLPMIQQRFTDAGIPLDLAYLPLIESAFSIKAYSRARAHGMWQFIASTGRYYGLAVGSLVDERRDPELSTDAAAAYLSDLYEEFEDWHLALAAYNSGAGNVRRAVRRSGSKDFWTLRRYLPRETRNYVPAYIASVIVAKRPKQYGFSEVQGVPWQYETLEVPDALDLDFLASGTGIPIDDLRDLNPAIRRDLTPARVATTLRVPPGTSDSATALLDQTPRDKWAPRMIHTVRSGENLYVIARRYGSTVSAIRQANGLRGSLIRPGQQLVVPRFGSGTQAAAEPTRAASAEGTYTVRRNDTLWDIARAFSVSVDSLCAANGLSRNSIIKPGQRLAIPGTAARQPTTRRAERPVASGTTHTVARGDTLYDIAQLYGVSVDDLKRINDLSNSRIYPGKVLQIPTAAASTPTVTSRKASGDQTYRVRTGDTLYDIARRFGVSVSALRKANGLRSSRIYPGDVLTIPSPNAQG